MLTFIFPSVGSDATTAVHDFLCSRTYGKVVSAHHPSDFVFEVEFETDEDAGWVLDQVSIATRIYGFEKAVVA